MSDTLTGVFFCTGLKARGSTAEKAFCKPVAIRVYSAPPPVRMRVVTYEMRFVEGEEQPETAEDWAKSKVYQSPFNAERTFSFTTGTLPLTLELLTNQIRRHFYSVVLRGEPCRTRTAGFHRLMDQNTATRRYNLDDETLIKVCKVHHVQVFEIDDAWLYQEQPPLVRYQADLLSYKGEPLYEFDYKGRFISSEHTYKEGRSLLNAAIDHFCRDDVRERVIQEVSVVN